MLEAFDYGAPPHGGIALGIDRWAALLSDQTNIREVMAFPKTQSGTDLMLEAPSAPDPAQYAELGLAFVGGEAGGRRRGSERGDRRCDRGRRGRAGRAGRSARALTRPAARRHDPGAAPSRPTRRRRSPPRSPGRSRPATCLRRRTGRVVHPEILRDIPASSAAPSTGTRSSGSRRPSSRSPSSGPIGAARGPAGRSSTSPTASSAPGVPSSSRGPCRASRSATRFSRRPGWTTLDGSGPRPAAGSPGRAAGVAGGPGRAAVRRHGRRRDLGHRLQRRVRRPRDAAPARPGVHRGRSRRPRHRRGDVIPSRGQKTAKPIGFSATDPSRRDGVVGDHGQIRAVGVRPDRQGRGDPAAAVRAGVERLRAIGVPNVSLRSTA